MSVEDRLARLERGNHRLKVAGLLAVVVAASVFLMGQARPTQRITASSFAVTNSSGEVVAVLGSSDDRGLPFLNLYAPGQDQPSISARLAYTETSTPQETVRRTALVPVMTLMQPSTPGLNTSLMLGLELDVFSRTPRILMTHDNGFAGMQMTVRHIKLSDAEGATVWEAP